MHLPIVVSHQKVSRVHRRCVTKMYRCKRLALEPLHESELALVIGLLKIGYV